MTMTSNSNSVTTAPNTPEGKGHIPVMLEEVISVISPKDGGIYLDATFGAGGYSKAILDRANTKVIAIDRDPDVRDIADKIADEYNNKRNSCDTAEKKRFLFLSGCFGNMQNLLPESQQYDGIVMDIGVSSMQLDNADRGFSFQKDGPLDMRMSQEGICAADIVNGMTEQEIADILYNYGEEKASRKIAKAIVKQREKAPFRTTLQLADTVRNALGGAARKEKKDPATRTFQALRIYVNSELEELESGLKQSCNLLRAGGRLAVVTFHSLEDRIVKQFMKKKTGETGTTKSRHMPVAIETKNKQYKNETTNNHMEYKKIKPFPIKATEAEIAKNPRARSAKLRAIEKISTVND